MSASIRSNPKIARLYRDMPQEALKQIRSFCECYPNQSVSLDGRQWQDIEPEKREAMRQLYPQADIKVFVGGEHGIALTHQVKYFSVIDEFLSN